MLKIAKVGLTIIVGGSMSIANAGNSLTKSQGSIKSSKIETSGLFKKKPQKPEPQQPDTTAPQEPGTAPIAALPGQIKKALEQLKLDAYATALNRDYTKGMPPLQQSPNDPEDVFFDDSKLLARTYQCRSFGIASKNNSAPPIVNLTYSFSNEGTGSLFRSNTSQDAQVKLYTFLADSKEPANLSKYDVLGQNDGQNYYEKIRVSRRGDIIIEGSTPQKFWAETLLSLIGLLIPDFEKYKDGIDQELDHLKLKVSLSGLLGMVLRYTYCPNDPAAFEELDMKAQAIMMEKVQNDPQYRDLRNYQIQ